MLTAVASALVIPAQVAEAAPPTLQIETKSVTIPTRDGQKLNGHLAQPKEPGVYPLIVMPGTWGGDFFSIDFIGDELAKKGYVTIGYNERGISDSTGEVDGGGPKDVADVSDVIDWALASQPKADKVKIGAAAQSYGGGIAVLASAFDARIRVVVNIAGWVDLENAVYQNRTRAVTTMQMVQGVNMLFGKLSAETRAALEAGLDPNKDPEPALKWARERSAATYLDRYAVNKPAIYMSHEMNEMLAPIDATMDFFEAFPGPKHEDLRAGDHGTPEFFSIVGVRGQTWDDGFRWLDAWLKDEPNGIKQEPAIRVLPRSAGGQRPAEQYATSVAPGRTKHYLVSKPNSGFLGMQTDTSLAAAPGTGSVSLRKGENWLLHVPLPTLAYVGETYTGRPLATRHEWIDKGVTGVWSGPKLTSATKIRGETKASLEVTPSASKGSVTVYLLDHAPDGTVFIIAQAPYTWLSETPGKPFRLDVRTPYNAYDLPAGHRIAYAVSTGDPTYFSSNPDGSTIKIGPNSFVDVPIR